MLYNKVICVNAPWIVNGVHGCRAGSRWPFSGSGGYKPYPHLLGYAVAYLRESMGDNVKFLDAIALDMRYDTFYNECKKFAPELIVFETSTPTFNHDMRVIEKLKNDCKCDICLVGAHVSATQIRVDDKNVDYVIAGDYENALLGICLGEEKKGFGRISRPVDVANYLPLPYLDKQYVGLYRDTIGPKACKAVKTPQLHIYPSRGCHKKCKFCQWTHALYKGKVQYMPVDRVMEEIDRGINEFGVKDIFIDSDSFGYGGDRWLLEFAEEIGKRKVPYSIMTTEGLIKKEMFKVLRESGCYAVRIGLETFSQGLYDTIGKGGNVQDIVDLIKYLLELDLYVHYTIMWKLLGETEEDVRITREMINQLDSSPKCDHQESICVPFPGTPYFDMYDKAGIKEIWNFDGYDGNPCNPATDNFIRIIKEKAGRL